MIKRNRHIGRRGFTLIETLVAIAILMIAIAGPLVVADKAYRAAIDARNQTIASNLAQETMEYLKNFKDNSAAGAWPADMPVACAAAAKCDASMSALDPAGYAFASGSSSGYQLYQTADGYSDINSGGSIPSVFYRYFTLTNTTNPKYALATVVVYWTTGTIANQVELQELMSNTQR